MNMESVAAAGGLDEEVTVTPAPKKPKLTHQIAKALEITPPPVVGRQSVPRRKKLAKKVFNKPFINGPKKKCVFNKCTFSLGIAGSAAKTNLCRNLFCLTLLGKT